MSKEELTHLIELVKTNRKEQAKYVPTILRRFWILRKLSYFLYTIFWGTKRGQYWEGWASGYSIACDDVINELSTKK